MTDMHHFTEEQIEGHLEAAKAIADRVGVAEEHYWTAVLWIAQKLAEKTIMQGAPALLPMQGRLQ